MEAPPVIGAGWLALALMGTPASAAVSDDVRVVLKFVKADGVRGPAVRFDPKNCPACRLDDDPAFARENLRESLILLHVPRQRTLELDFVAAPKAVRRVIVESGDVGFAQAGERLTVSLPPLIDDAITAGEFSTHIVMPGVVLRFEHDDEVRRAGAYAAVAGSFRQRQAANVLEFAQLEAIRRLGIGTRVDREALGTIELMGFDTNFPHGHSDAPAHMHMHLRWPTYAGTQIAHYYIDDRGLLNSNKVGVQMLRAPGATFGPGETFTTIDRLGRPVYSHMITTEGWLRLSAWDGRSCLLRPAASGFDGGTAVQCEGGDAVTVQVSDDMALGKLTVRTGAITEIFRYDRDTGTLISAQAPPPPSASNYPPRADGAADN